MAATVDERVAGLLEERTTRAQFLRAAGAGAGTLLLGDLLSACGGSQTNNVRGGTLRVGAGPDDYTAKSTAAQLATVGAYPLNANVFEGLVRMDSNYNIVPALATRWTLKPPTTWRFELRRGVTFHDGTPFDARAVKYTFDKIAGVGGGTPGFGPDSTKIIDSHTVDVTPTLKNLRMVEQLVHPENYILARGSDPGHRPIGTGPFRFVSYTPSRNIVVERNPRYWGAKALLDRLEFNFIADPGARRLALQSGDADLILDIASQDADALKGGGFNVVTSPVGAYEAMYANVSGRKGYTILSDSRVRHAVDYAIDRDALIRTVFAGLAAPEETMIPSRLLGPDNASNVRGYRYDTTSAQRLLDQAGWKSGSGGIRTKGGKRLTLQLIDGFPEAAVHGSVPEFVQGELRKVGVDVSIIKEPDSTAYGDRLSAGTGDLYLERGNQNDANPAFLPALLFSKRGLGVSHTGYQTLFAPGGAFETLIDRAIISRSEAQVKALTAQAMHELIDVDAIVIPLAGVYNIAATSGGVQGFELQPSELQTIYAGVSLAS